MPEREEIMAWNYDKGNKSVLRLFDRECRELCYSQTIPEKVAEARKVIEACKSGTAADRAKERVMHDLRNAFDPYLYNWDAITLYDEEGEMKGA